MSRPVESNKAKIAKRVIEVLEYFDDENREATVMDIVRRYERPQSSTSELLSCLVDLGLLYKDPVSRTYTPTPRAAVIGTSAQPYIIRSGRMSAVIERLVAQTGLSVAMFGMVGLNTQIFSWCAGNRVVRMNDPRGGFANGAQESLAHSAAGTLLLSTVPQPRRDGLLRRLNAEAAADRKFAIADMAAQVQACQDQGYAVGPAGFGAQADVCTVLVPEQPENQPLALGFIYEPSAQIDPDALVACLREVLKRSIEYPSFSSTTAMVQPLYSVSAA